ncbi:MAG TPA: SdrD B-like domain-containing protein, partial [Candidatus Hydrogenedentes bacterium]|nr:SdrD B-like domain-containing protein [Candidatus Hydrogenedentota bacterium]
MPVASRAAKIISGYYDPTDEALDVCGGLQKRFLKSLVLPGETVGVTLTYFNGSYLPAINMVVTDPLPSGMTYVAGTSKINGVTTPPLSTSPLTWNIGYVEPYGLLDITFDVVVTGTGDLLNTARAESNQGITYANDTIRSGANDFLVWDKYVFPSAVAPGGTVNYTVEISNIGTGPNGIPFVITEYLPAGFTYVSMVSKQINGGLLPDSLISINAANPNQPIFTINQGIQAGQALVLTFKVLVGQNVPPETYCNYFKMGFEGKVVASAPDACVNVGGGSIGDTIWRDWDGDGIQDELEEGIQGVTVSLYNDVNGNGVYDAGTDTLITSQVTDNTGFYNFEGLTDGMYVVVVDTTATGLVQHSNTGDPDGGTLNQAGVTLADNSGTDLIDFGYKPGGPGIGTGSIGDTVFEDMDGNGIFDGSDAGIPNVTVNLYEDTNGNGEIDPEDLFISAAQSDASGNYLFSDLASGAGIDYIVDVVESDPDIAAYFTTQGKTYFATTSGEYSVLNLSGASLINDFGFQGVDPGSIGDTVFFDSNANGVYDLGVDIPLANVTVSLYYDANGDSVAQPEEYVDSRDTDASGQYTFDNLSPERYLVLVDTGDPDLPGGAVPVTQQYVVTLGSGQNYTTADFPFVEIFTKTVDKAFALPGDLLTYSINLNLPTDTLYQNLTICDPIPGADVSFVSASAGGMVDGGYTPVAPVNGAKNATSLYVEDQFTTNGSYSGSNGTATWASNWAETGDDGLANAGGILVAGNRLRIDFNNTTYSSDGDYVERGVNLSEVASASMTYTLQTNELDTGEYIYLEVKGSGTAWVLVDTVTLGTATGAKGPFNLVSILQAASPVQSLANPTAIRFRRGVGTGNDQIEFDNIRIDFTTPNTTTAIAVSPTQVGNGGALTVTMTVGSSAAMTGVTPGTLTPVLTDGAAASLLTGPTPASASIAAGGTAIFTWTYTMTDTASPAGTVKFTGAATGTITGGTTYAFASATSGTAQVIPGGSGTVCWNLGSHVLAQDGVRIAGAGIYAFRGGDIAGGPFWRYDPSSGLWNNPTDPTDFGATVNGGGSLTTDGTYIYALQGDKTKTVKRYDPAA